MRERGPPPLGGRGAEGERGTINTDGMVMQTAAAAATVDAKHAYIVSAPPSLPPSPQINLPDRHGHNRAVKHEELPPPNQECAAACRKARGNCERKAAKKIRIGEEEGVTQL